MSKLDDFIRDGKFPIIRTGLSNDDWDIQTWKRKEKDLVYTCSLCDSEIKPDDILHTHIQRGYTVPREGISGIRNESEVLGFICKSCNDEITEYDQLYYG